MSVYEKTDMVSSHPYNLTDIQIQNCEIDCCHTLTPIGGPPIILILSSAVVPTPRNDMLPQHLKPNVLHHPMPWSLLRYVALFILGNGVLHDMTSDVTKEYSNTNHTINVMTAGMEKLMEEYRTFKAGTKKDPVSNVKGENVNNFKLTIFRQDGNQKPPYMW